MTPKDPQWEAYKKTLKPLKKSKKQPGLELQKKIEITIQDRPPEMPRIREGSGGGSATYFQESLQYKSTKKLKRTTDIQGRLDLHGMTQEQALGALVKFIHRCYRDHRQDLLVITGKGIKVSEGKTEGGILRRQLPGWLEHPDLRPYVYFYTNQHPFEGGAGAFYVRLRRD